jgi:hypothetical protein
MAVYESQNSHLHRSIIKAEIGHRLKSCHWIEIGALVTACALFILSALAFCHSGAFSLYSQATSFGYGCLICSAAIFLGELIYKVCQSCRVELKMYPQIQSRTTTNDPKKDQSDTKTVESPSDNTSTKKHPLSEKADNQLITLENTDNQAPDQPETNFSNSAKENMESDISQINPRENEDKCEYKLQVACSLKLVNDASRGLHDLLKFGVVTTSTSKIESICFVTSLSFQNEAHYLVVVKEGNNHQILDKHHLERVILSEFESNGYNDHVLTDALKKFEVQLRKIPGFIEESICCILISEEKIQAAKIAGHLDAILYSDNTWQEATFSIDKNSLSGSYLVIASEGFWKVAPYHEVQQVIYFLSKNGLSPDEMAHDLAKAALKRGSLDTITVFVANL